MAWTEERVRDLKRLWEEGHSASYIANELGEVTRNAVIGKAHRLGLSSRPSPIKSGGSGTKSPRPKRKPAARRAAPRKAAVPRQKSVKPETPRLSDLERRAIATAPQPAPEGYKGPRCQWPIGDPGTDDFQFCGAPAHEGRPYCTAHCQIAYRRRDEAA